MQIIEKLNPLIFFSITISRYAYFVYMSIYGHYTLDVESRFNNKLNYSITANLLS